MACSFIYYSYPKYSDRASTVDQNQTGPKDCLRSTLFARSFIKHFLLPQKDLSKLEDGKVH